MKRGVILTIASLISVSTIAFACGGDSGNMGDKGSMMGAGADLHSGAMLARRCVSCHGANFKKAPLGRKAHIVNRKANTYKTIIKKIKYYQHPKESDEMIMQMQVKNLSDSQIKSLARYISSLK